MSENDLEIPVGLVGRIFAKEKGHIKPYHISDEHNHISLCGKELRDDFLSSL